MLNQGLAPIVIFDVDFLTLGPGLYDSAHEHAAVICGHYYDLKGQQWFIANCWSGLYSYSANLLQKSVAQLAQYRKPETFNKFNGEWISDSGRYQLNSHVNLVSRQGIAPKGENASFRNKIILIAINSLTNGREQFCITAKALNEIYYAKPTIILHPPQYAHSLSTTL